MSQTVLQFCSKIPCSFAGKTLIDYLSTRFTYHSLPQWEELIQQGRVLLEGQPATASQLVRADMALTYSPHPFDEPAADINYSIAYEDEWLLGINKPGNLLVHRSGKSFTQNLMYQLRFGEQQQRFADAGAINRLDRETSGVVLVARQREFLAPFQKLLREGEFYKEYQALVHGLWPASVDTINLPIGPQGSSAIPYKHGVRQEDGKDALTKVLGATPVGGGYSLLRLSPLTGRTHQLRVHCAALGHPLVGDKLYALSEAHYLAWRDEGGSADDGTDSARQMLHCSTMRFIHPFTNQPTTIEAPLPADFIQTLQRLQARG
jgi:RluA family pseudouridine synthase